MKVYVAMPVALEHRAKAAAERWTARGYFMSFFQDYGTSRWTPELTTFAPYVGVYDAINRATFAAFADGADVVLFAGDDMFPDPNHFAEQIGEQYLKRFPDGFGVMQPCADRQGQDEKGVPAARRICGSPWYGKGWATRAYRGLGPCDPRYWHFYGDESLMHVAEKLGVLWWREDLLQDHAHWSFGRSRREAYHDRNQGHWEADRRLFLESKAAGFPEGEALAC